MELCQHRRKRCFRLMIIATLAFLIVMILVYSSSSTEQVASLYEASLFLRQKLLINQAKDSGHATVIPTSDSFQLKIESGEQQLFTTHDGFLIPTSLKGRRQIYQSYYKRIKPDVDVDCQKIVAGDKIALNVTLDKFKSYKRPAQTNDTFANISNCAAFKKERGYIEHPLTVEELEFPLAFGLLVYKQIEQVERLLRAIYRPQHYYCFHVDLKNETTRKKTYNGLVNIARCFDNVFVASERVSVTWGEISIVQAEHICMKELWKKTKWKYYINLTGQEFPLKTNFEIMKILKAMDGANVVFGSRTRAFSELKNRWEKFGMPPHNITPVIGSTHVAINRDFVDFALHDRIAQDFLKWLENTSIPDETFYSSLHYNPQLGIPGSFLGEPEEYPLNTFIMRYKNWERGNGVYLRKCNGMFVRFICIFGLPDISKAVKDIGLYANKFFYDYEPLAYDCLEEWLHEHTWKQAFGNLKHRWDKNGLPPHGLKPVIGSTHAAINRDFVDFILHNQTAKDFMRWLQNTVIPDETFLPTLNYNPQLGIPGSFLGKPEEYPLHMFLIRHKKWYISNSGYLRACHGKYVRDVCVLGLGDISKAVRSISMFANKFFYSFEPLGYDCLDEWVQEHTWEQYLKNETYNTRYVNLHKVKHQIRKGKTSEA